MTDVNGCSDVQTFEVPTPDQPEAAIANFTHSTCGEENGMITVTVSGGAAPFTYQWGHDPNLNSPTLTNLAAGLYSLTVTDANLCQSVVHQKYSR